MADGAEIVLKENGPAVVSGDFTLVDEQGNPMEGLNPIVAICRCGQSANKPFCDGTHTKCGYSSSN